MGPPATEPRNHTSMGHTCPATKWKQETYPALNVGGVFASTLKRSNTSVQTYYVTYRFTLRALPILLPAYGVRSMDDLKHTNYAYVMLPHSPTVRTHMYLSLRMLDHMT